MNVLFLTLVGIESVEDRGIYQDLLRTFRDNGHNVTIVTPVERRRNISTNLMKKGSVSILQVKTLNVTKTNFIEKGFGTIVIQHQYLSSIKKHLSNIKFDLILYSTPPITFVKVIEFVKKRDSAYSYLLLKDIFPQNAVDMGMLKQDGIMHKYFSRVEKRLYNISDTIGCMSPANVKFVLENNQEVTSGKIEVNPNSIEPQNFNFDLNDSDLVRNKYNLPLDKKILIYGGNLGKPQGLSFLLETINSNTNEDAFFLIVGDGTEYPKVKSWFEDKKPNNAKLIKNLPKKDYDELLSSCDIGLIFLDSKFTIPNFPSRLLSYLEMRKPIIAATDNKTDIGDIIEKEKCGIKVLSGDIDQMNTAVDKLLFSDLRELGINCGNLLEKEYHVNYSYQMIMDRVKQV